MVMSLVRQDLDMQIGNNNTPFVAIWMVTYNHENYISQAVESVMTQVANFEYKLFIGEDCSTDDTSKICKKLKEKYSKKIELFLNEKNLGGNQNAKQIYKRCYESGAKYIALLEGDDYWTDPLKLQKQVDVLESNTNLIASHHWQTIAVEKNGKFIEKESPKDGYYPKEVSTVEAIFTNKMRAKSRTLMFRNIIDSDFFPNWYSEVAFGDVPLTFLLGEHGDFGFINESMAVYRQTDTGVSTAGFKELGVKKFSVQHLKNWIQIWDYANKHYNYKFNKESTKTVRGFYNSMALNLPITISTLLHLLKYNIVEREMPVFKTMPHTLWLLFHYGKYFGYKLKRKLQKL